jgi:coronatine-insensitive protein 1
MGALSSGCGGVHEEALHLVLGYVDGPRDRAAASLVCRRWHRIDALTRKHVTVGFCYAAEPARLRARFPRLESLAIKGKPRAAMYGLIPDDWGAYAAPWLTELAAPLECLKAVHLRRMAVTDHDIAELVRARGHMLQVLKLDKCSGFSTDALRLVARSCRYEQLCPWSPSSGDLQHCYFFSLACLSLLYAGKVNCKLDCCTIECLSS